MNAQQPTKQELRAALRSARAAHADALNVARDNAGGLRCSVFGDHCTPSVVAVAVERAADRVEVLEALIEELGGDA